MELILFIFLIPTIIAGSKGRSIFGWFLYSVILWPVALVHAIALPEKKEVSK